MKKLLSLFLAGILAVSCMGTAVLAEDIHTDNISDEMNLLAQKYNFEMFDINESKSKNQNIEMIDFDSIEDFEIFMQDLQNYKTKDIEVSINPNTRTSRASVYNSSHLDTWWAPYSGWGMTALACWKNVSFNYSYKFVNNKPQFVSLSNVHSNLSGINVTSWNQTNYSYNFTTKTNPKDKAQIQITGYYLLGVNINGFNVGLTQNSTWNYSVTLT